MKKVISIVVVSTFLTALVCSSCSSGASHQSWHPKEGKRPKPGKNR